ncbi:MAG: molybdopterin-dependent oxidoreductase, partial [Dehalococcoidia bacterium]
ATRAQIAPALKRGAKLIVVDPRNINLVPKADIWLRLRPGSDGFLALGMLKVIIEEKLYDQDFVAKWTEGFGRLQEELSRYSLEQIAEKTWVPQEQIAQAARLYASSQPAAIQWGNALDQSIDSFQTCRAISILRAITGNLDVPGGELMPNPPPVMRPADFMLLTTLKRDQGQMVGAEFKMAARHLFVPRQMLTRAILEEKPYPVKALITFASNPLLTFPMPGKPARR